MTSKLGGKLPSSVPEFMYATGMQEELKVLVDQGITDLELLMSLDNQDLKVTPHALPVSNVAQAYRWICVL